MRFYAVAKAVVFVFVFMRYLVAMVVVAACLLPWLSAAFLLALACSLCLAIAASSSLAFLAAASCLACVFEGWLCMYVCMYRGRPLWRCPWDWAFQLGQGEGPIGLVGPISQPRGTIGTHAGSYLRTNVRFLSKLYFRQLSVLCPHVGGTETHQTQVVFDPADPWERGSLPGIST